jgi:hypothetical protein
LRLRSPFLHKMAERGRFAMGEPMAPRGLPGRTQEESVCRRSRIWRRSRAKELQNNPFSRSEQTSQVSGANVFTSDRRERLHPPSLVELWRDRQARRNWKSVKCG